MSLIHTAELHQVEPFDYRVALQRHAAAVALDLAGADCTRARPVLHPVRGAHTVPDRLLEFTQAYRKDTTPWARAKVEGLYLFMLRERRRHQPRA